MHGLKPLNLCYLLSIQTRRPNLVFYHQIEIAFRPVLKTQSILKRGLRTALPNTMPHAESDPFVDGAKRVPRKLVLCFDGTGNEFMGNTSDTNIVKLYDKLDRKDPYQYHYYQSKYLPLLEYCESLYLHNFAAGIGTYDIGGGSINKTFLGSIRSKISRTIDTGFATTFDAHVIAGYRFIMRYYKEGDKIYIFGFSRGAFTARFLARMIFRVGLLSEGNEEQIPFAYDLYQQYETGKHLGDQKAAEDFRNKLYAFKMTFCRCDQIDPALGDAPENLGVKVHFLGMFDCVSSVAVLDSVFGSVPKAVSVVGTARHVRHAVAVDEHRVKFRAALLQQDENKTTASGEDIKEVWFPGNHGDVGGGWPAPKPDEVKADRTWWQTIRGIFVTDTDPQAAKQPAEDFYQMSDIPLAWMIRELELLGEKDAASAIQWGPRKEGFKRHFYERKLQAYNSPMHSTLKISGGSSLFKVMLWNFMGKYTLVRDTSLLANPFSQNVYQFDVGNLNFKRQQIPDNTSGL